MGALSTTINDINSSGDMVGTYWNAACVQRAFFLSSGGVFTAFWLGPRLLARPPWGKFERASSRLRASTMIGAALFGLGWGVAGICPGAMLASLGTGNGPILLGIGGAFLGAYLQGRFAPEE